jgi:hypothetical protein
MRTNDSQLELFCAAEDYKSVLADESTPAEWSTLSARERMMSLKPEFVRNITQPGTRIEDMTAHSKDWCEWRCSRNLGHSTWERRMVARARRDVRGWCPACAREDDLTPEPGQSLLELHPEIAAQFVENLTNPWRTPELLRPGADDECRWECSLGHRWEMLVQKRTGRHSGGPDCKRPGQSRFEREVAALVSAVTGLTVGTNVPVVIQGAQWKLDLHIHDLDLYLELDPLRWHKDGVERDQTKAVLLQAAGLDVIRIRQEGLPPVSGTSVTVTGMDPWDWVRALRFELKSRGAVWKSIAEEEIAAVLGSIYREWMSETHSKPSPNAHDEAPHLMQEFVENLTHGGVDLHWLSPGANDMILWRCADCEHMWNAMVNDRVRAGYGCNPCGNRRSGSKRAALRHEESLLYLRPDIAGEFVRCLDRPELGPGDMRPGSNRRCEFKCKDCSHIWPTYLPNRTRLGSGCPECDAIRRDRIKIGKPRKGSLLDLHPMLAKQFVKCIDDPDRTVDLMAPWAKLECVWRCPQCAREWEKTPYLRLRQLKEHGSLRCPAQSCRYDAATDPNSPAM